MLLAGLLVIYAYIYYEGVSAGTNHWLRGKKSANPGLKKRPSLIQLLLAL